MKKILWVMALVMIFAAGNVYAGKAVQMWNCGLEGDATEEALEAHASAWLKAAKALDGGENLEAFLLFPVAVNATGDTDFMYVLTAPTFAEWGKFWDVYPDSEVAASEGSGSFCPDSVLWESVKVE